MNARSHLLALIAVVVVGTMPKAALAVDDDPPAVVVNGVSWSGSPGSYSGSMTWNGYDASGTLYINGQNATISGSYYVPAYTQYGYYYMDDNGNQVYSGDTYHESATYPFSISGGYIRGVFWFQGFSLTSVDADGNQWPAPPPGSSGMPNFGPPEVWANGELLFCYPTDTADYYYSGDWIDTVVISGSTVTASGTMSALTGSTWNANAGGGVFIITDPTIDMRPADATGALMNTTTNPVNGPPGVAVNGVPWKFQGTVAGTDYYTGAFAGQRMAFASNNTVSFTDAGNAGSGYYNLGVFQDMGEPVRALAANGTLLSSGGTADGPASVILSNGQVWYRTNEGGSSYATYAGPQSGQVLYITSGSVWISDPVDNIYAAGTYANGAFDVVGVGVKAGDVSGSVITNTLQSRQQNANGTQTVTGNLDVYGNLLTLGTFWNDTSSPGFNLIFTDLAPNSPSNSASTLSFVARRPANQWIWAHANGTETASSTTMKLDQNNSLMLYSPLDGTQQVVLTPDPTATTKFPGAVHVHGAVRVLRQGDLSMGEFTSGPQP